MEAHRTLLSVGTAMKKIEALLEAHQVEAAKEALSGSGANGLTVTELRSFAANVTVIIHYRGAEQIVDLLPKVKLEVVTHDDLVDRLLEALIHGIRASKPDDGDIWVLPVDAVVRIRTGEIDEAAIA